MYTVNKGLADAFDDQFLRFSSMFESFMLVIDEFRVNSMVTKLH